MLSALQASYSAGFAHAVLLYWASTSYALDFDAEAWKVYFWIADYQHDMSSLKGFSVCAAV